ncbi:ATP-binding protein [Pseudomonas putida]|uniref:Orc1-like AAA ATPase domain-containing protein n=1 Tax=Pseudomonas putida TaxID=303 RepID=A0A177S9R7_PSEPU|nr:ATP-binding protein [Pseudomonas putida]OAI84705.1 hypothetical protein AYO28_02145 [Pseudomonas putida]
MKSEQSRQEILALLKSDAHLGKQLGGLDNKAVWDVIARHLLSEPAPFLSSRTALQAALCSTFCRADIDGTAEQIEAVLNEASVQISNGLSRLRLNDGFRSKVLLDAQQRGELEPALRMHDEEDSRLLADPASNAVDLESAWLRRLLRNEPIDLEHYSHAQVSAAYRSRLALCECEELLQGRPTLADIQRQMQWLELIEPMRLMIGAPQRQPHIILEKDRFAGRGKELRELRSFVDALDSQGTMESLERLVSRTGRRFSNKPRLMMISARGGLGKSTLISKFAYDHAVMGRGMPFAYLDFDSAILQPHNPLLLLAEVIRQVSLFFPYDEHLIDSIEHLHKEARSASQAPPLEESEGLDLGDATVHFLAFRAWLRAFITERKAKAFLLILDTLELVQSDPQAIDGVQQFLRALTDGDFPELVIVASGRAEMPELWDHQERNWNISEMTLEPFNQVDARRMVQRLGEKLLSESWQPEWSTRMIGDSHGSAAREPLSLRIAVEAVRDADPDKRDALVDEIATMGEGCDPESVDFVGRLYQKRILEHIGDPYARQLAWPGLVARSISRELATNVLAPECGLSAEQADVAFGRLKREVWIVTEEGGALRHRPDLRARTLPLMRRHNAVLFTRICALMSAYHMARQPAEPLEATYYQLLADDREAARILDEDESGRLRQLLLTRLEDFTSSSLVAQEVHVRQASHLLPWPEFQTLSKRLAWRHLEQSGRALKGMDDRRIDPRVVMLSRSIDASAAHKFNAAEHSILIKTGRWAEVAEQRFIEPQDIMDLRTVAFLGNFLASVSWTDSHWLTGYTRFLVSVDPAKLDWLTLAYMLLPSYLLSRDLYHRIDAQLANTIPRKGLIRHRWLPALRVILAFGTESLTEAVHLLSKFQDAPRVAGPLFSQAELEILRTSRALEGHRIGHRGSLLGGFFGKDNDRDLNDTVHRVLERAVTAVSMNRSPFRREARTDIRRFALAGFADLAGPAGYLLSLSKQPVKGLLKHVPNLKARKIPVDLIQFCKQAEQDQELHALLYGAQHEVRELIFGNNLGLLEAVSENWHGGLYERFDRDSLP